MSKTKKVLAVMLTIVMLASLLCIDAFAITNRWEEFKWDFQSEEIDAGSDDYKFESTISDGVSETGLYIYGKRGSYGLIKADPAGNADNKVLEFYRADQWSDAGRVFFYHAYANGMKTVFSFKYYVPATGGLPVDLRWSLNDKDGSTTVVQLAKFTSDAMTVTLNPLTDSNGNALTLQTGVWNSCTIVVDDTTGDEVMVEAYHNGEKVLPKSNLLTDDGNKIYGPLTSGSYSNELNFNGTSAGTLYLDDLESRITREEILTATPTVSIDEAHQGESVLVDAKEIELAFTAGTDNLMDTSTYKSGISVSAGAAKLKEGTDYEVSYSDLKNAKITLYNNMAYNTTYTIAVADTVKNVAGVSAPATFTFKTEAKASDENAAPTVSITGLIDKVRYNPGEKITFSVTALDGDGDAIKSVKIYDDGTEIASDSEAPYEFEVSSLPEGTHKICAVATDEKDAQGQSAQYTVIVKENTPTTIYATIKDGFKFLTEGNVTFSAEGVDEDGEAVSSASISVDGGAVMNGSYSGTVAVGEHIASIKVTDSRGNEYTKEIKFVYQPEYYLDVPETYADFDDTDIDVNSGDFTAEKEMVVSSKGNSLAISAGDTVEAGRTYAMSEDWSLCGMNAIRTDKICYEFMVEDVKAQIIRFPGSTGGYDNMNYINDIKIINGVITDTSTGITYGKIESGRWYNVELYITGAGQEFTLNVGENQCTIRYSSKERENEDGAAAIEYKIRAIYYNLYEAVSGGSNGKKAYFDNFGVTTYGRKYADIYGVYAVDSKGTVRKGDVITDDTQYFIVDLESGWPETETPSTSNVSLFKNGVAIGCAVEFYGIKGTNNSYSYYTKLKVTPAEPIVAGQKYTVTLNAGAPSYPLGDTIWSDSTKWSAVSYSVDKIACEDNFLLENAGIYDGDKKVLKISEISGEVNFKVDVANVSGADKNIYVIIASYADERLDKIKIAKELVVNDSGVKTISTPKISVSGAEKVKGFIWISDGKAIPYSVVSLVD